MPARNPDLHGSAPDKSETALLIVDVINDLDFPEAKQLMRYAPAMAREQCLHRQPVAGANPGNQRLVR